MFAGLRRLALVPVGIGRHRAAFGDADHGRAQQAVVEDVAWLQHFDDGAGWLAGIFHLEDRLVEIMIEALALRLEALYAVLLEGGEQFALGSGDAGEQAFGALVGDLRLVRAGQSAAQIVGRAQEVAGNAG